MGFGKILIFFNTFHPALSLSLSGSFENTRMCLLKIQEPLQKQIIIKLIYYKGKTKIGFYPKNLDPTGKYNCKTTFLPKT